MSRRLLHGIPPKRRDALFGEIHRLTAEVGAIDRSLDGHGEGFAVDEALEEIVVLLGSELKQAKRRLAAA
jgi:hypothetical protein